MMIKVRVYDIIYDNLCDYDIIDIMISRVSILVTMPVIIGH
jgi:hypothetical protein